MATTTNFGWETPDDTDLVKDGAAAIRTALGGVDTSLVDLKGGTTGQFLSKASNTDLDYSWVTNTPPVETNPNLIINGNFTINQRAYVSAANLASGSYGFDRWKSNYTNTALTFTSAPAGQSVTISTSGVLVQIVEQANVPAGTYTLSWSGTATGRIYNSGGAAPSYAASPVTFTADGLADVVVEFTASGSTKTLSKVKLELGSAASAYSYAGGTIAGELAACQRYYEILKPPASGIFCMLQVNATTSGLGAFTYGVQKRVAPTITFGTAADFDVYDGSANRIAVTALTAATIGTKTFRVGFDVASGLTIGQASMLLSDSGANAQIQFSAEL
jgi:hypothetical protein